MKKLLKWVGFILLGLALTLVVSRVVAFMYRKEILAAINEKLQTMVNGNIEIGDARITLFRHFPNVSIALDNIYLNGTRYETYRQPFLTAEAVDINIELFKLFSKEISIKSVHIKKGKVFVFRAYDSYTNLDVFKTRLRPGVQEEESSVLLDLKKVYFNDVAIMYVDSLKKKTFGVHFNNTENTIVALDSSTNIHVKGRMKFDGLMFNSAKGTFVKNKDVEADLYLELDSESKVILIKPSNLEFEKSQIKLSGLFQLSQPGEFQLDISCDKLDYQEGVSILADTLASKLVRFQIDKPVNINVSISGVLQPGVKPTVDITFAIANSKVAGAKGLTLENTSIAGSFINHLDSNLPNDDQNSQIHFATLKGIVNNLPVDAVVTLTDLRDPALQLKAIFDVDLKDLNGTLDTTQVKMTGGHFKSNFSYSGKLREYLADTVTSYAGVLSGKASVTDGKFTYYDKKIDVEQLNGTFAFTEKRFDILNLSLKANKNDITIKGNMTDFIPFFVSPEKSGKVRLSINSPRLEVTGLPRTKKTLKTRRATAASKKKVADMIETLNEQLEFNVDFKLNQFINKDFKAKNLTGNLILINNEFIIKNAKMDFAKGKVALNVEVSKLRKELNPLHLKAKLTDVDLSEFFFAFNNFNQTTIRHDHLEGKLDLDIELRADIDGKLNLITRDLEGVASFTITDGRLKDFEPMQRLSNFLLKDRDFSDIQFGEITSNINLSGTQIHVNRMEVESTAITMFIEGEYDIVKPSDLSIQVPLSNLKKREQDFPPENVGVDKKVGASVFLRVRPDKTGKTTISYDPFKRFRKKKKNGDNA